MCLCMLDNIEGIYMCDMHTHKYTHKYAHTHTHTHACAHTHICYVTECSCGYIKMVLTCILILTWL